MGVKHTTSRRGLESLATEYAADAPDTFELPEDLATLSDGDLEALETAAVEAFDAIRNGEQLDAAALEDLETLAAAVQEIRAEAGTRAEAREAAEARAAELAATVAVEEPVAEEETEEVAAEDEGTEELEAEEAAEVVAEAEAAVEAAAAEELEPVAAAARRPVNLRDVRRRQPKQEAPAPTEPTGAAIVASADVPGLPAGAKLNLSGMAQALSSRLASLTPNQGTSRLPFASIKPAFAEQSVARNDEEVEAAIKWATDERRLPGGSLVAAGGMSALTAAGGPCAAAESMYDLCSVESSMDGLLTLPEIVLARGRANIYDGYAGVQGFLDQVPSFEFTAAQEVTGAYQAGANAGDPNVVGPKDCLRVPCDLTQREIDATGGNGLCITGGLMHARSFSAQYEAWIEQVLVAYEHKRSQDRIAAIIAGSDAVTFPAVDGATAHLLHSLEISATSMRARYRLADDTTLVVHLPSWVKGVVRTDLAKRMGVDLLSVSDARIEEWFTQRNLAVSYLTGWQIAGGVDETDIGTTTPGDLLTFWPAEVDFIMYPFGTWRSFFGSPDITWSAAQVSNDLATIRNNDRFELFTESFELVDRCRSRQSLHVTVPICADGATAAGETFACQPAAPAPTP